MQLHNNKKSVHYAIDFVLNEKKKKRENKKSWIPLDCLSEPKHFNFLIIFFEKNEN